MGVSRVSLALCYPVEIRICPSDFRLLLCCLKGGALSAVTALHYPILWNTFLSNTVSSACFVRGSICLVNFWKAALSPRELRLNSLAAAQKCLSYSRIILSVSLLPCAFCHPLLLFQLHTRHCHCGLGAFDSLFAPGVSYSTDYGEPRPSILLGRVSART